MRKTIFHLLPKQAEAFYIPHTYDTDFCCYQGGLAAGKTHLGVLAGYSHAKRFPGLRVLVCAREYTLVRDTTRRKWLSLVPMEDITHIRSIPDEIILNNGSEIWFRPADSERLRSTEFGFIHIEEGSLIDHDTFLHILSRLRQKRRKEWMEFQRRLIITTNPQHTPGWIDRTFYRREDGDPRYRRVVAPTSDNLFLAADQPYYAATLASAFDPQRKKIYVDGETGSLGAGYTYYAYNPAKSLDQTISYDPTLPLHITFDFNVAFMYAAIFQDESDRRHSSRNAKSPRVLAIDEIALTSSATEDVCKAILSRYSHHAAGLHVYGDPTGYHKDTRSRSHDYEVIHKFLRGMPGFQVSVRAGDHAKPAYRVRARVATVNRMLSNGRYQLSPNCRYLIRSLAETRWDASGETGWKKKKVSDPSRDDYVVDHPHDAADYYFAARYPEQTVRTILM